MTATAPIHVVMPGDVADPAVPSGGSVYDRRLCAALPAAGRPVREIAVPGTWPRPAPAESAELARALDELPAGADVLLDGLVACGVPDIIVPRARRLRLAVLVHLPLADETGLPPAAAADLDARERDALRAAAAVVTTGAGAARALTRRHGIDPARVHAVPPGTDAAPLAPGTDGASALLCVASLTPRKGHDVLVRALAGQADLTWTCECVGPDRRDPAYAARLRALIERHGLGGRIRLAGPRAGAGLDAAYAAADLLVLPSRAETYGMVVAEALARGIPVVAGDVGGVPEALGRVPGGGVPGILVPAGDAAALAAALRRWLGSPSLRDRLRSAARRRRTGLETWDAAARRMAAALDGLAAPVLAGEPR